MSRDHTPADDRMAAALERIADAVEERLAAVESTPRVPESVHLFAPERRTLPEMPDTLEALLADHSVDSHGMTVGTPDLCHCGAHIYPNRVAEIEGEDIARRRARAHANHLAVMIRDWLAWHGTADLNSTTVLSAD